MCVGIALSLSELPSLLAEGLADRVHNRGGEPEVRFLWSARPTLLPVFWEGQLHVVRWGNRDRAERQLPPTGWTWRETVEAGRWAALAPEPVVIPAEFGLAGGVWYKVKQGVRGLLVRDRSGRPLVYMICEPATRYYRVMTRAEWMPTLVDEVI
jgi:hypothetical protein